MSYHIYRSPASTSPPQVVEFSSQTTASTPLPDGGALGSPNASSVVEVVASSLSFRSVFIYNKGPGTVHLHLGAVSPAWEASPESARRLEPGDSAQSTLETCKLAVHGWSEGEAADLIVDVTT